MGTPTPLLLVAGFLTIVGLAFKVSVVPFHFWAPDIYEGALTPVTAFLSVASKAGGFVALLSVVVFGFFPQQDMWQPVLWVLAAASMILGNLVALRQTNVVRMLAYSSIVQGGFILVPFAVAPYGGARASSIEAVVVYILIYGAMPSSPSRSSSRSPAAPARPRSQLRRSSASTCPGWPC